MLPLNMVPTTWNLEVDNPHNFHQTDQQYALTIYTKLQITRFSTGMFLKQIIEYEDINQDECTDLEQLSFIMIVLKSDGRCDKSLCQLRIHKNMFEKNSKKKTKRKVPTFTYFT